MTSLRRATLTEPQARRHDQLLRYTGEGQQHAHPVRGHPYVRL